MPHYIYSDSLLTAVHRAMRTPLLLTLDIGGRSEYVQEGGGADKLIAEAPSDESI